MEAREALHRLLYTALVEMRVEAHEQQNQMIFHLADLFHNVPLQLERVAKGEGTYEEILQWVETRASEKKINAWFDKHDPRA